MRIILAGALFIAGFMLWAQMYGAQAQLQRDARVLVAFCQTTSQQDGKEQ